MGNRLYVGNLSFHTDESELQDVFGRVGTVQNVKLVRDRDTGQSRGFAFVEMSTDEEAQKAITELHGQQLGGRSLTVNEARPQPERSGGGGFGSRGKGGFGGRGGSGFGGGNPGRRRSEPRW